MATPSYAVRQLARTLKEARLARGLSQRELAERAGFGQNRLALIESGRVDLRATTLVQVARALDLELVLTPRRVLPAVQSLIGSQAPRSQGAGRQSVRGTPVRVLRDIQTHIAALEHAQLASETFTIVKSAVQALTPLGPSLDVSTLQPLRRALHSLTLARANTAQAERPLARAAAQLQELSRMLPALAYLEQTREAQRAAYSLEDEIS